jgi:hypothetical protein
MPRRAGPLAVSLVLGAVAAYSPAAAQLRDPQPLRYLLTAEADDLRALWVNPAQLSLRPEADVGADLTVDASASGAILGQLGITVLSGGVAAGWVHDRYRDGGVGDAYAVGLGLGESHFGAGFAYRWYRVRTRERSFDLGLRYRPVPWLNLSLLWRNVGSPVVRERALPASLIPGGRLALWRERAVLSAEAEFDTERRRIAEYRVAGRLYGAFGLSVGLRADLSPRFQRRAFSFSLIWGQAAARAALVGFLPGSFGKVEEVGLAAIAVAAPPGRARRP